jgi:hypothetical protein
MDGQMAHRPTGTPKEEKYGDSLEPLLHSAIRAGGGQCANFIFGRSHLFTASSYSPVDSRSAFYLKGPSWFPTIIAALDDEVGFQDTVDSVTGSSLCKIWILHLHLHARSAALACIFQRRSQSQVCRLSGPNKASPDSLGRATDCSISLLLAQRISRLG